jgi:catechol 2,3-dioxygenase-like lactoylglutathione lyase family enzyme
VKVLRLFWLGVATAEYEPTLRLWRDVLGLRVVFEKPTTAELELPSGDRVQVLAPGDPYFGFFDQHARGPVALFEVDNVYAARAELVAAGVEVVGDMDCDADWEWLNFRGPDGNLYELASRRSPG